MKREDLNKRKCIKDLNRCLLDSSYNVYEMEYAIDDLKDFLSEKDLNNDILLCEIDDVEKSIAEFRTIVEELQKSCETLDYAINKKNWTCCKG